MRRPRARELRREGFEDALLFRGREAQRLALRYVDAKGNGPLVAAFALQAASLRYLISLDRAPADKMPRQLEVGLSKRMERHLKLAWSKEKAVHETQQQTPN